MSNGTEERERQKIDTSSDEYSEDDDKNQRPEITSGAKLTNEITEGEESRKDDTTESSGNE